MENRGPLERTPRTTLHRIPDRGSYDRDLAYSILDEGLYASVGIAVEGQPFVIPMVYGRMGDRLILHGAAASRLLKAGAKSTPICVTVTLVDGLVFARSGFHHSMNYRSVMVLGEATEITDTEEKLRALDVIVDHAVPGRSKETRPPNRKELVATRVLALSIVEASVKMRTGGPKDDDEDLELEYWAGHVPLRLVASEPISDAAHPPRAPMPEAVASYRRR
ncbi:pyridoxamine 5'-phosphate oxidase family protein [Pendulispora brunnea]|uniref:Pyridoxamine 5'-phosphate oxidase family protein n=1 Tax=Pendulispora brunnea TaxID=2905690 RepID=A0ABZ2KB78_9BACT